MLKSKKWMIYGANGYTGELIARLAVQKGYAPYLAGRNEKAIQKLAEELKLSFTIFDLEEAESVLAALQGFDLLLNCAGPYTFTAKPLINACLSAACHYLDITGELQVFEQLAGLDNQAKAANIALLPGVGFDVVPTDCLAAHLKERLPDASHLLLAFKGVGKVSKGTALTALEHLGQGSFIRQNGALKKIKTASKVQRIDFGVEQHICVGIPWGDLSTAWHSTGTPNIEVYMAVHPKLLSTMRWGARLSWLIQWSPIKNYVKNKVKKNAKGPDETLRRQGKSLLYGKVWNAKGQSEEIRMVCAEAYHLTTLTAIAACEKLSEKSYKGFLTPSKAFGKDFILGFEGTHIR